MHLQSGSTPTDKQQRCKKVLDKQKDHAKRLERYALMHLDDKLSNLKMYLSFYELDILELEKDDHVDKNQIEKRIEFAINGIRKNVETLVDPMLIETRDDKLIEEIRLIAYIIEKKTKGPKISIIKPSTWVKDGMVEWINVLLQPIRYRVHVLEKELSVQ